MRPFHIKRDFTGPSRVRLAATLINDREVGGDACCTSSPKRC